MPRQRRRHHSRSRSRSRSHSQEKDRDVKRRKVEVFDSPNQKRSVSPEDGSSLEVKVPKILKETQLPEEHISEVILIDSDSEDSSPTSTTKANNSFPSKYVKSPKKELRSPKIETVGDIENIREDVSPERGKTRSSSDIKTLLNDRDDSNTVISVEPTTPLSKTVKKMTDVKTPGRRNTPNQMQKKLESEKKRLQREKEREDREKQKQDEKDKKEAEKLKKKEEKQREIELKQKEKEEKEEQRKREKEQRKLEKEKKEEQRRKEKEEEKVRRQQELDEKSKEKLKEEEKKQKAAAAFVSFFVPKKLNSEDKRAEESTLAFMPFEVKSDMKLPIPRRKPLTQKEKDDLVKFLERNERELSYLRDLKSMTPRFCPKTWPCQESEEDVTIIDEEEDFGETICEEKPKSERMRSKYMKFHENRRPAYYGTWRKKANLITGRRPFVKETIFDYDVDSDDDWEEEEQGENLEVLSDDDKENEAENEDYEVDNEFFVPHGHLSDDEVDDEETSRLSPESQKEKLKLLKDAFDEDIKSKTYKIKPRSIGCIWYNKNGKNVDAAIDRYLLPLAVIITGQIIIKKRDVAKSDGNNQFRKKKGSLLKDIPESLMPILLKLVHGHTIKRKFLALKFLNYIQANKSGIELSKANVSRHISNVAQWTKNAEVKSKFCWMVNKDVAKKYSVDLILPNVWESVKDTLKI